MIEKKISDNVESALTRMSALKSHRTALVRRFKSEYRDQALRPRRTDMADYRTNVGFALVNQKLADLLASLPRYDFIGMDEKGKANRKVAKLVWDYWWKTGMVEKELFRTFMEALQTGAAGIWEYPKYQCRDVRYPVGREKDGRWKYEEKEIVDHDGPYAEFVSWENLYIDAYDLSVATTCAIVKHWLREDWLVARKEMLEEAGIDPDEVPAGRRYYWYSNDTSTMSFGQSDPKYIFSLLPNRQDDDRYVSEIHYYDKSKDEYIIVANGVHINPDEDGNPLPLPSLHKELPIAIFTDHWTEGDWNGRGEFDVTFESRALKDALRSLSVDGTKASMGVICVRPDADFDEGIVETGPRSIARIDKEDVSHFAPTFNAQIVQYMEGKTDEDIIMESGTDFKQQLLSPQESASKTVSRVEAQKKRISLCLKLNAWTFFERLARLRMSDIVLCHMSGPRTISVKGEDYNNDNVGTPIDGGFGTYTVRPEFLDGTINVVPDIESMTLDTTEMQKQMWLQELQILPSIIDPETGKPVIKNMRAMLESGKQFMTTDVDKLMETRQEDKSPEKIMAEAGLTSQPMDMAAPEMNPSYIPPAQRSGARTVNTPGSPTKFEA